MFIWMKARIRPALRAAVANWRRDDGFLLSAALAYYASVWMCYASAVVLLGAEFVRVLDVTERRLKERGA